MIKRAREIALERKAAEDADHRRHRHCQEHAHEAEQRAAREQRQLSVEQVARELRLSPHQIVALEDDEYEKLPGATYVRGYLRSYARLLGLPEESILRSSRARAPGDVQTTAERLALPRQVSSSDRIVRWFTYLLVTGFVVLLILWWQGRPRETVERLGREPVSAADRRPADGLPASPASEGPAVDAEARRAEEVEKPKVEERPAGAQASEAAAPAVAGQDAMANDTPAELLTTFVLRYRQDCWTDIRDARGRQLVYRTVVAGSELTISGVAPFQVFFGFAPGVDVFVNGKLHDIQPHIRRGVFARFELDPPPADRG